MIAEEAASNGGGAAASAASAAAAAPIYFGDAITEDVLRQIKAQWDTKEQITEGGATGCAKIVTLRLTGRSEANYFIKGLDTRTPGSTMCPKGLRYIPGTSSLKSISNEALERLATHEIETALFITKNIPDYVSNCTGGIINSSEAYIIYEYINGMDLAFFLRNVNTDLRYYNIETVVHILQMVKDCLNNLHLKCRMAHSDIKPSNLFITNIEPTYHFDKITKYSITAASRILLIDFGNAQLLTYKLKPYSKDPDAHLLDERFYKSDEYLYMRDANKGIERVFRDLMKPFYGYKNNPITRINQMIQTFHTTKLLKESEEIIYDPSELVKFSQYLEIISRIDDHIPPEKRNETLDIAARNGAAAAAKYTRQDRMTPSSAFTRAWRSSVSAVPIPGGGAAGGAGVAAAAPAASTASSSATPGRKPVVIGHKSSGNIVAAMAKPSATPSSVTPPSRKERLHRRSTRRSNRKKRYSSRKH
jgi:serine/threonine protein kinase